MNSIKKPMILVIWPTGFRPFDWDRLELDELSLYANVEVHEVISIISPHFLNAYSTLMYDKRVMRFETLTNWVVRFRQLLKENAEHDLYILNFVSIIGWLSLFINICIHRAGVTIVEYRQPGLPAEINNQVGLLARLFANVKVGHYDYFSFKKLVNFFNHTCLRCLAKYAIVFSGSRRHFLFLVGMNQRAHTSRKGKKDTPLKVVPASSWDYSRILRLSSLKHQPLVKSRYAVLLDGAGPKFHGDELLTGIKLNYTSERWYPALCRLFDRLEIYFNLRIVIAAHPKASHERFPTYFGGREVFHADTYTLVKNADFVLTRFSTAISYGLFFHKPILFLTSDELELIPSFTKTSSTIIRELGSHPINVDHFDDKEILQSMFVDLDLYNKFIFNYLTSSDSRKPNYQILLNDVMGIEMNIHSTKQF
jgi:hypothetical protein